MRVRLDVSYDGTDFSGWAIQPHRRTVQGELQLALATVLRLGEVTVTVAGRTDAGVHAIGQVAHLDVPRSAWDDVRERVIASLAGVLPVDVRVRTAVVVPDDFDARFSALWRRYEYRISNAAAGGDPVRRRSVLDWRRPLDDESMAAAAGLVVGLHDFAAFCRLRENATSIRSVQRFDVERGGDEILCTIQADAFCHSMVRSLVGALLAVGEGRRAVDWPASLLGRDRRVDEVPVAPAHGLTLVEVGYPPDAQFGARSLQTRARRS